MRERTKHKITDLVKRGGARISQGTCIVYVFIQLVEQTVRIEKHVIFKRSQADELFYNNSCTCNPKIYDRVEHDH